jgi:hypothetical protein
MEHAQPYRLDMPAYIIDVNEGTSTIGLAALVLEAFIGPGLIWFILKADITCVVKRFRQRSKVNSSIIYLIE